MIVAHGHFGRVFTARWVGFPLAYGRNILPVFVLMIHNLSGTKLTMDAGAVSEGRFIIRCQIVDLVWQITILSYNHNTLEEPSITALNLSSLLL